MISVAYITMRKNNQFDWFWEGLLKQVAIHKIPVQLIYVDYWKEMREIDLSNDLGIEITHVLPLPSPWQGKHQVTKETWFACANARNTAFVYAIHPTVAFCDDLTVLGERWLSSVIESHRGRYIALGSYSKQHEMVVEDGVLISGRLEQDGKDPRMSRFRGEGKHKCNGDIMFTCSCVVPLNAALSINGFDCLTDSIGYEDGVFGIRLQKAGYTFYYDKRMYTVESQDHPAKDFIVKRMDKMLGAEKYLQVLNKLGLTKSTFEQSANKDSSHILVDVARQKIEAAWNFFSLRDLRNKRERGEEITLSDMNYPLTTWFDDTPLIHDELIKDVR